MSVLSPEPALARATATLPSLRLIPVPVSEPPYDDELPAGPPRPATVPLGPLRSLALLRLVPDPDTDELPPRTPTSDLPAARPMARTLVQGLLEVLAGVRPLSQLRPATSVELYDRLELILRSRSAPTGPRPTGGAVRSLHIQERTDGVAEVCATVQRGVRTGALALRLEGRAGRWRCTEIAGL